MSTANGSDPAVPFWRALYRRRLQASLENLLNGGLAPKAVARALAVGALLGCMPLPWGTSLLCLGAALLLRLNPLAVQAGNFAAWPLQLLLAYPYLQFGSACFGVVPGGEEDPLLTTLAADGGAAIGAWGLSVPLLFPLYYAAGRRLVAAAGRRGQG
jgi:Uncharacterized protein conserved in bacteria (DUF2062)